jgi:hypothetical protein
MYTDIELTMLVVIATDSMGSCKSNYYTITSTTIPYKNGNTLITT